jgi:hypothetical protein
VLGVTDPAIQRARSGELLRSLWSRERPAIRARAVEVRVYATSYRLGPGPPTITRERLLHRFGIEELERRPAPTVPRRPAGSAARRPPR